MSEEFDYGTEEEVKSGAINFKNPELGPHTAVLRSIIHMGLFCEEYGGQTKKPCAQVVAIFELKGSEDFEEDGETPLTISKTFPLKKGDKAFMTKFLQALDPKGVAKGFNDVIGKPCTVEIKPSKKKDDDGKHMYVNFGGLSGMTTDKDVIEVLEAKGRLKLAIEGVGHVSYPDLTKEAIMELNPIIEVANILMKGEQYEGSKAQELITEIRVENADFAKQKTKDKDEAKTPDAPASDLDDNEEF